MSFSSVIPRNWPVDRTTCRWTPLTQCHGKFRCALTSSYSQLSTCVDSMYNPTEATVRVSEGSWADLEKNLIVATAAGTPPAVMQCY